MYNKNTDDSSIELRKFLLHFNIAAWEHFEPVFS